MSMSDSRRWLLLAYVDCCCRAYHRISPSRQSCSSHSCCGWQYVASLSKSAQNLYSLDVKPHSMRTLKTKCWSLLTGNSWTRLDNSTAANRTAFGRRAAICGRSRSARSLMKTELLLEWRTPCFSTLFAGRSPLLGPSLFQRVWSLTLQVLLLVLAAQRPLFTYPLKLRSFNQSRTQPFASSGRRRRAPTCARSKRNNH